MEKLGFANAWGKSREISWSGTPLGIYLSLNKKCALVDYDLSFNSTENWIYKALTLTMKYLIGGDFGVLTSIIKQNKLNRLVDSDSYPIIMFDELLTNKLSYSYVYQDLTVDFLLYIQESKPELLKYTPLSPRIKKRQIDRRKRQTDCFYNECKGLFTMSQFLADFMKKSGVIDTRKIHCVGGGCNIDITRIDCSKKKGNKFLFVGKDFERKNGPLVVEAFKKVRKRNETLELYIAGPEKLNANIELSEGIVFLGLKTYDELVEYYNMCDYFVMPSRFEAYGIVFAEALIFGLPCIGKNAFAMPEFIEDGKNGFLIEEDNIDELSNKMIELTNNNEMSEYVRGEREKYIKKYSWDAVAERMLAVIETDNKSARRSF